MNCNTLNQTEARTSATSATRAGATGQNYLSPFANVTETADGYVLEAELPGVGKEGLEVTVEDGELVIVGKRTVTPPTGKTLYRESRAFDYRRVFELDASIDATKIVARIDQGVLTLQLPKTETVKPRKIEIAG